MIEFKAINEHVVCTHELPSASCCVQVATEWLLSVWEGCNRFNPMTRHFLV